MANTDRRKRDEERDRLYYELGRRAYERERSGDEQVDLLGISRRDKLLHGSVYAIITLIWVGIVIWDVIASGCWNSQQPRTSCIIDAAKSIDAAVFPVLMLTITLIVTGRSTRAAFRRMLMVLPVLRDKYAENLQAAEARGEARGEERGESRGEERGVAKSKMWYERMRRAEQSGEPFNEPPPWEK